MIFKNEKQLEHDILTKSHFAVIAAQERIYHILNLFLSDFYRGYTPEEYKRTEQLFRSLVKSDVKRIGNQITAEVYFDLDYLYDSGNKPSGEQVMAAAAKGKHGAIGAGLRYVNGNGADTWNTPMPIINAEAINILKEMLIREGVPIK